jgi:hypothetical protein
VLCGILSLILQVFFDNLIGAQVIRLLKEFHFIVDDPIAGALILNILLNH